MFFLTEIIDTEIFSRNPSIGGGINSPNYVRNDSCRVLQTIFGSSRPSSCDMVYPSDLLRPNRDASLSFKPLITSKQEVNLVILNPKIVRPSRYEISIDNISFAKVTSEFSFSISSKTSGPYINFKTSDRLATKKFLLLAHAAIQTLKEKYFVLQPSNWASCCLSRCLREQRPAIKLTPVDFLAASQLPRWNLWCDTNVTIFL